ncbi:MAG: hypothetical protein ACYC99_07560, partial [Candidatus Geothermincolia bacterium]
MNRTGRHHGSLFHTIIVMCSVVALILASGCGRTPALKDPTNKPQASIPSAKMLTAEDILGAELPFGPYMSPDGTRALWTKAYYPPGAELPSWEMYVTDLVTLASTKAVSGSGLMGGAPSWSPDGTAFSYIAAAPDGTSQLFTVSASGGQPIQITSASAGVTGQAWRNAATLVFTAPLVEKVEGDDTIHVTLETNDKIRLFQVSASGGESTPLTRNDDQITNFWVSPDGSKALTVQTKASGGGDNYYQRIPNLNYLVDLSSGTAKQVFKKVRQVLGGSWSPDSRTVRVEEGYTPDSLLVATTTLLQALDTQTGTESAVELDWSRGIHSQTGGTSALHPTAGGFLAMLADGCNPRLAFFGGSGGTFARKNLEGEHQGSIFSFDVSKDAGRICYLYSTPSMPPQMYVADVASGAITNPRCFTNLNPGWSDKEFVRHEVITWKGANGDPVEGIL